MTKDLTYQYKTLQPGSFDNLNQEIVHYPIHDLNQVLDILGHKSSLFIQKYSKIELPGVINQYLESVLTHYQNIELKEFITTQLAFYQYVYSQYEDEPPIISPQIEQDFFNLEDDLSKLLETLRVFLTSKSFDKGTVTIVNKDKPKFITHNFFILQDILTSLCEYYNLSLKNFSKRRVQILNENKTYNRKNSKATILCSAAIRLNSIFNDIKPNSRYRLIGFLMRLFQLPTIRTGEKIELFGSLDDNLNDFDTTRISNLITRLPK